MTIFFLYNWQCLNILHSTVSNEIFDKGGSNDTQAKMIFQKKKFILFYLWLSYLSRDHGIREVPWCDHGSNTDGFPDEDHLPSSDWSGDDIAINPPGLLWEPLKETGTVADLAFGLGKRLPLLLAQDSSKLILVLVADFEPFAEECRALLGGGFLPRFKSLNDKRKYSCVFQKECE